MLIQQINISALREGIEENINKEIEEFKIAFKNLKEHERNYYKATYNQMLEIFSSAPYKINE